MSDVVGVTEAKRSLKALLEAQLPAKLAYADAQANDGVTTPPPAAIHRTNKMAVGENGYPVIELMSPSSSPQSDSYAHHMRHRIVVAVTVANSDDEETLTTQLERYLWAIRHVAKDVTPDDYVTGPIDSGTEEQTPVGTVDRTSERPFVQGGFIELFMTTVE